jgi:hypothetical protein
VILIEVPDMKDRVFGVYILGNMAILNLRKLVDNYLEEIAHDPNLSLSSFVDLSESIPDFARPNHDVCTELSISTSQV